jgi:hypothetical protein
VDAAGGAETQDAQVTEQLDHLNRVGAGGRGVYVCREIGLAAWADVRHAGGPQGTQQSPALGAKQTPYEQS